MQKFSLKALGRQLLGRAGAAGGGHTAETELRKWYGHDPERFEEFGRRYQAELAEPERAGALAHLRELASGRGVTLLTATRQPEISEAAILARLLRDSPSVG